MAAPVAVQPKVSSRRRAGMVAYAFLFCGVVPAFLAWWAHATRDVVAVPMPAPPFVGAPFVAAGLALMLAGTVALWRQGSGLPMNAFPPPRLVTSGVYALVPHPIYVGFALVVAGTALLFRSASGLWLVAPTTVFCCAALTLGFETPALRERFESPTRDGDQRPRWLPDDSNERPDVRDWLRCYLFVLLPWVGLYELVVSAGVPRDAIDLQMTFERTLGVHAGGEIIYATTYVAAAISPMLAPTRRALRRFMILGWIATVTVMPLYLALPTLAPRRPFVATSWLGGVLAWERATYQPVAACPSFHMLWALFIADLASARGAAQGWVWRAWAWTVGLSCVTTGMHTVADVVAALVVGGAVLRYNLLWELLRRAMEGLANSWREWRIGPVRFINHGVYAGLATSVGVIVVNALAGPHHLAVILLAAGFAVVGSALWAQRIEGSPRLLRPYGFYGGVAGIVVAAFVAPALGMSAWLLLGAYSVAAPLVQSIGRLRCLVQGCCHGKPASAWVGIRYVHPRSRVCRLTAFRDLPIHPAPLYSILWNAFVLLAVSRLWSLGAALHLVAGTFAILNGVGRFVEEAYRGEPQTPCVAGLRLYQWISVAGVVAGALVTAFGISGPAPAATWSWAPAPLAAAAGVVVTLAFGADLPDSNRRFARLA